MKHCLALVALLVLSSFVSGADVPNFVWLVSEDNSVHYLKLFDDQGADTPCIERMARQGLVFEHAFSNAPVCSVARTSLMSGCYAPRIATQYHRKSVLVPLPDALSMFPAYLRRAGYFTSNNNKKDYNAIEGDDVWSESSNRATWRNRQPEQPFFHMQNFAATHESSLHFPATALVSEPTVADPSTVFVAPYHPDTPTFRYTIARYHDRIRQMDAQIGEVVDKLAEDGLLEDTFIFYFGDNGGVLPRSKAYAYDGGLHVPLVVRVPANWRHLVPWQSGTRVRGFVSFVDFGPTLLRLAGLDVPEQVDGRPFLGAGVSAAEVDDRDEAFGYADRFDEKCDLVRTLRKGRFEYVRSYQPFNFDALHNDYRYRMLAYEEWRRLYESGELQPHQRSFFEPRGAEMLFDLEADPYETTNLAGERQHAETLADLRGRLAALVRGLPDLSFYPESYLVEAAYRAPVRFGQLHQQDIGALIEIADLSLSPFAAARVAVAAALESDDPWHRYWGLIVCSCFGRAAQEFAPLAQTLSWDDPNLLVRTRAAEFLGLIGAADPRSAILAALAESRSPVEVTLILNTVVLLQDGPPGYDFEITPQCLDASVREVDHVQFRLAHLAAPVPADENRQAGETDH